MNLTISKDCVLGPARALTVAGRRVLVALPEAKAWATLALAHGYDPVPGDVLLVLGQEESFYVIGVLSGRGRTRITAHGDLELRAPHGHIALEARDGISLRAGFVRLVAKAWDAVLETVRQRCRSMLIQVLGTSRVRAARLDTAVDGTCRTTADRIVQRAATDVHVDGEKIHLG